MEGELQSGAPWWRHQIQADLAPELPPGETLPERFTRSAVAVAGGVRNELDVLGHGESRGCCWYHIDPSLSQPIQVHLITILLIILESTFHYWESNFLLSIKEIPKMYKRILQTRIT